MSLAAVLGLPSWSHTCNALLVQTLGQKREQRKNIKASVHNISVTLLSLHVLLGVQVHVRDGAMISVVIPTLNSQAHLAKVLTALVGPAVEGVVREVIVADGGSEDLTLDIVDQAGAKVVTCDTPGRGGQLCAGAAHAAAPWLLFLHADTVLAEGWDQEAQTFIRQVDTGQRSQAAGVFRFRLDDDGFAPRALEAMVDGRARWFKFPYGDQGLLISRQLYDEIGGFQPLQLMEDVDLVRRIGRRRIHTFRSHATTSAERFREHGYLRRIARNQMCLALYYLNVSPDRLVRFYAAPQPVKMRQT